MLDVEVQTLRKVPLFRDIEPRCLQLIAFVASRVTFLAGETIFEAGSAGEAVYIVLNGEVDIFVAMPDGGKARLATFGPGRSFGEIGVLTDAENSMTIVAQSQACLLQIQKSDFLELTREIPQLSYAVMRDLARRLDHMIHRFASHFPQ